MSEKNFEYIGGSLYRFHLETSEHTQMIDMTGRIQEIVEFSGVSSGLCTVFIPHTTAAVTVNERNLDAVIVFIGDRLASQRPWNTFIQLAPGEVISDGGHRACARGKLVRDEKGWKAEIQLPLALLADADCCRIGLERCYLTEDGIRHYQNFPAGEYDYDVRLQFGSYTTDMMLKLEF